MKKISLLLVIVMLLGSIAVLAGCGSSQPSVEDEITEQVQNALVGQIAAYNVINGKSLYYTRHTISITTVKEGKSYQVEGKVYAMSGGTRYTADYYGEVEYDAALGKYDADVDVGSFR